MNRLYKLAFLFLVYTTASGQSIDSSKNESYIMYSDLLVTKSIHINGQVGFVTTFVNNALIRNDFWSDDIILDQINSLGQTNRLGAFVDGDITYMTGNKKGLYFGIGYKNIVAATSQKELIELAFRGNSNLPSIKLEQKNAFEQTGIASISIGRAIYDSASKTQIAFGFDIYAQQQHTKIVGRDGLFQTDSAGESLTVSDADIVLTQNLVDPFKSLGIGVDFEIKQQIKNRDYWSFSVSDLGIIRSSEVRSAIMLSDFDFDGFDVSSQINSAGGIQIQDSFNQNYFNTDTTTEMRLVPFRTSFRYIKSLGIINSFESRLSYLYFTGYYPLLEASYQQQFKSKSAGWRIGARIGGFGSYGLNLGINLPFGTGHSFKLDVAGLESMASNNLPINWYSKFGLIIQL